ncbi:unnamed protein product [Moneuplotes crassus]|uniref:Uncharacterized protein n=1 Tax=Euplotes crassus TaxID=5936 RepID=A0AAD2D0V3_EUPCR|nr:unnamed protein product [Moneuplotes crassus]
MNISLSKYIVHVATKMMTYTRFYDSKNFLVGDDTLCYQFKLIKIYYKISLLRSKIRPLYCFFRFHCQTSSSTRFHSPLAFPHLNNNSNSNSPPTLSTSLNPKTLLQISSKPNFSLITYTNPLLPDFLSPPIILTP